MPARYRAAIFDMDGTLVDNMEHHARAWFDVARSHGASLSRAQFERELAGKKNEEIVPLLLRRAVSVDEVAEIAATKEARYRALYAPDMRSIAGLPELLASLRAAGVRLAIATAAPRENRVFVLGGLGLDGAFEHVIGAEQARRGKPAPDLYLLAAQALGEEPARCLVFEDALNGVRAGRAAGMDVAAITTLLSAAELGAAGAQYTLDDFTALPSMLAQALGVAPR